MAGRGGRGAALLKALEEPSRKPGLVPDPPSASVCLLGFYRFAALKCELA